MYSYKIWDKKSPINGVSAKEVIEIHKIDTSGEIGLILDNSGKVMVLQYDNSKPQTKTALTAKLKVIVDEMNSNETKVDITNSNVEAGTEESE